MKKYLLPLLIVTITLAACNKNAFLKKLTGDWKLDRYLFSGQDRTILFDTTFRGYTLSLEEDNRYLEFWSTFTFKADSLILSDTLGYDSVAMQYVIDLDTLRFIDTTITPTLRTGEWQLINSDEDLQLRDDTSNVVRIYRILELNRNSLKLRKGNEEFYYGK